MENKTGMENLMTNNLWGHHVLRNPLRLTSRNEGVVKEIYGISYAEWIEFVKNLPRLLRLLISWFQNFGFNLNLIFDYRNYEFRSVTSMPLKVLRVFDKNEDALNQISAIDPKGAEVIKKLQAIVTPAFQVLLRGMNLRRNSTNNELTVRGMISTIELSEIMYFRFIEPGINPCKKGCAGPYSRYRNSVENPLSRSNFYYLSNKYQLWYLEKVSSSMDREELITLLRAFNFALSKLEDSQDVFEFLKSLEEEDYDLLQQEIFSNLTVKIREAKNAALTKEN